MKINRLITEQIKQKIITTDKAVVIYGARQVGKTTLARDLLLDLKIGGLIKKPLSINADEGKYVDILSSRDSTKIKSLVEGYDLLFIDEAQRVPEIGLALKIIVDQIPGLKVIATGSSSFDLANKISEPLTGRAWDYTLFPIAAAELAATRNDFEMQYELENLLVYGAYPEVVTSGSLQTKQDILKNIGRSYLYKDILAMADIKHSEKIVDLLKLLAFQVGSRVSINELANNLNISRDAVSRYIDLLEKSFVIFRLRGYSGNLRKELSKMDKIYFYDLGIRNLVIDNFKQLKDRNDVGQLWENFLVLERKKVLAYGGKSAGTYFWRAKSGTEIDYVEDSAGQLHGYEFKFSAQKKKPPLSWTKINPQAKFSLINKDNYLDFVTKV